MKQVGLDEGHVEGLKFNIIRKLLSFFFFMSWGAFSTPAMSIIVYNIDNVLFMSEVRASFVYWVSEK